MICSGQLVVVDTDTARIVAQLPASDSALAEVEYLDETHLVFAGADGVQCCEIPSGTVLWTADAGTALAVSSDGSTVAAIDRDAGQAVILDAASGTSRGTASFDGHAQQVVPNDLFANPNDSLLALNEDGSRMAVSFSDGQPVSVQPGNLGREPKFCPAGEFTHFEGGFSGQYLAFGASGSERSVFAVLDTITGQQTGGFQSDYSLRGPGG